MIYGEPQTIKLSHPLVFAVSQTSLNVTETFNHIQSGLFVGMAKNVRIMIRQLRALAQTARTQLEYLQLGNALHYAMVSDQDLQFLIRVWVYHHLIVLGNELKQV